MPSKTDIAPAAPAASEELAARVVRLRRKRATLHDAHETLLAMGCSVAAVGLSHTPVSNKRGLLRKVFMRPASSKRDVVREGLATICDIYGSHPKIDEYRVALVLALSVDENWLACLQSSHDPHALALNSLAALRCVTSEFGFSGAILGMLNKWLREGRSPIEADPFFFKFRWSRLDLEEDLLRSMFGDAWWVLSGQPSDRLVDLSLIMRDRPQFLPGLALGLQSSVELLPEMF